MDLNMLPFIMSVFTCCKITPHFPFKNTLKKRKQTTMNPLSLSYNIYLLFSITILAV